LIIQFGNLEIWKFGDEERINDKMEKLTFGFAQPPPQEGG